MEPDQAGPGRVRFSFDGRPLQAAGGMTVAGALLASGIGSWRQTPAAGRPRGVFCATGTCFDCLVDIGARPAARACLVLVRDGDEVRTSRSSRPAS